MPIVALTEANLEFIKKSLRTRLSGAKSSHLSEAIAAGLGYKTYAALIADQVTAVSPAKTAAGADNLFRERLGVLSGTLVAADLFSNILRCSNIPDPLWRVFTRTESYARDQWYWECERRGIPFIYVGARRILGCLEWDCITVDASCDDAIRRGDTLVTLMFKEYQSIAPRKGSLFFGSAFIGSVDGLLIEEAKELADRFAMLLDRNIARRKLAV